MNGDIPSLADATHNPNIILLAGAGASYILGYPTLDDIMRQATLGTDEVAELIIKTKNAIEACPGRYRAAVFEELIVKLKYYIRLTETLRTDNTYRSELGQVPHVIDNGAVERKWKKALTKCYRVILETYGPDKTDKKSKEFEITLRLFEQLAKINSGSLHIYTTNYDCSYQVLASNSKKVAFLSHINNLDGKFLETDWYYSKPEQRNTGLPLVYMHRLHGCAAWFNTRCFDDDVGFVKEVFGAGEKLEIADDDYLNMMCIKLVASQLLGTNPAFSSAFEELARHSSIAKALLVWGYSFRDLEVIRQINQTFYSRSQPLKIYYIDPYLTEFGAVHYIQQTLHNAPVQVASEFKPKQIDWRPTDGLEALISAVVNKIEKGE